MTVRTTYRRRVATGFAVALTGALVLTGCAAGQRAQTANEHSVVDGGTADVGQIGIRNAGLAAPAAVAGYQAGEGASLVAAIVNNGTSADVLVSVTSAAATSVQMGTAAPAATTGPPSPSAPSSGSASTSGSASSSASASPSPGATPQSQPIPLPARTLVQIGGEHASTVELAGLKAGLVPGQSVAVTFTFRDAGAVTVQLPVKLIQDSTGGETIDVAPSGA